jgi:hypothetical protein
VLRYIEDGRAPDFSEYYYESSGVGQNDGKLLIMPAGSQEDSYGDRFKSTNWRSPAMFRLFPTIAMGRAGSAFSYAVAFAGRRSVWRRWTRSGANVL